MQLVEVNNKNLKKLFLQIPFNLYKEDPNWIAPLSKDVNFVFNSSKNSYYKKGNCIRWILFDDNNLPIGRIAAFINFKIKNSFGLPTGGFGFFECINNQKAANTLLSAAKNWLSLEGLEAMEGPINFQENDKYWGLIVSNFSREPYYGQNYNPEYYKALLENYGLQIFYKQFIYTRSFNEKLQEKYSEKAKEALKDSSLSVCKIDKKRAKKFAEDFREVYNQAWANREAGFTKMSSEQALKIMNSLKPIMDENLIVFSYHNDKPIGFFVSMPELNAIFKHFNGNLNWLNKLKFLYHQKIGTCKSVFGIAFGIVPEYQGKGIEGVMFQYLEKLNLNSSKYSEIVITWIGDFNPKMIRIIESLGAQKIRTMAVYRYLFDTSLSFHRKPFSEEINKDTRQLFSYQGEEFIFND